MIQQQVGEDNINDPLSDQGSGNDDAEESEEEVENTSNGKEVVCCTLNEFLTLGKKILISNLPFNPLLSRFP